MCQSSFLYTWGKQLFLIQNYYGILVLKIKIPPLTIMEKARKRFDFYSECYTGHLGLWQCPPFLFIVMGFIVIASMIATYALASRSIEEPEMAALIVAAVTALLVVIGGLIINGFEKISEANRMKTEFISIVSHELRSPLSIFKWTLDILSRDLKKADNDKSDVENFVHTLRTTTENMILLVNSLLEVSRIDSSTFVLRKDQVSIEEITRNIIKNFENYARSSNVQFALMVDPTLGPLAILDRERITMVIKNLVDNAIRYTPASGTITISIEKEGGHIRWKITDQGTGIPLKEQKFVFRKFFRAKNITSRQAHGSGIGLYLAKAIIEASQGTIGFSSQEGKGSTFYFTLPLPS